MPLFTLTPEGLTLLPTTTFVEQGLRERDDLQRVLRDNIEAVAPGTLVIAEEFREWDASQRRIDLLAVDREANLVVIELKRGDTGAHMELQALRYAAMVARMTFEQAVSVYGDFLARHDSETDARTALLSFLGWDEPDETAFAQDVRVVLVAADFSRELTSSVMWLNERDLDIRCVQLRPHVHGGEVLLDIRQVIPLPEASEYQVQVREKARRERAGRTGAGRDLTRYDLTVGGETHHNLPKRRVMLAAVRALSAQGIHPDKIALHLESTRPFTRAPGRLTGAELAALTDEAFERGEGPPARAFLLADKDLIYTPDETLGVTKRWRQNTEPSLERLRRAFPDVGMSYEAIEPGRGQSD